MTARSDWLLAALVAVPLLAACGARPAGQAVEVTLVESEATLPAQDEFAHADIATDRDGLEAVWDRFELSGEPPSPDLEETVLLFAGFGESSSCPASFEGIYVDDGNDVVSLLTAQEGSACTDDFSPRTFVIAVDRDALPGDGFEFDLARVGDSSRGRYVLSTAPTTTPPDGATVVRTLGTDEAVEVDVDAVPSSVRGGDEVEVVLDNRGDVAIRVGGPLAIVAGWHDQRWLPHGDQPDVGPHPGIALREGDRVAAGDSATIGSVDTSGVEPGWYEARVSVSLDGQGGRIDVRAQFEVAP